MRQLKHMAWGLLGAVIALTVWIASLPVFLVIAIICMITGDDGRWFGLEMMIAVSQLDACVAMALLVDNEALYRRGMKYWTAFAKKYGLEP